MKSIFIVMVLGYWGKADTLRQAAFNCRKEGAKRSDMALAYRYTGEPEELAKITVDDSGNVEYPQTVTSTRLFGPRDGNAKSLSQIILETA